MSYEHIIPEFRHAIDIFERGPATGPEVDAANRYLKLMDAEQRQNPDYPRQNYLIDITRDGKPVHMIILIPCTEGYALARMNCAVLDYWDCQVVLLEEVETSVIGMEGRVHIEVASYIPEEDDNG